MSVFCRLFHHPLRKEKRCCVGQHTWMKSRPTLPGSQHGHAPEHFNALIFPVQSNARTAPNRVRASPDAAIAEESQRALAQVNARIEAQRRGRGSVGGGMMGFSSSPPLSSFGGANGARAVAEAQIRNLAERQGVRVQILDDRYSPEEQIRALAREYGLRIQIVGEGGGEGGDNGHSDDGRRQEESTARPQTGVAAAATVMPKRAGLTPEVAVLTPPNRSGSESTPPPTLSSLRPRPRACSRSPSPAPRTFLKV